MGKETRSTRLFRPPGCKRWVLVTPKVYSQENSTGSFNSGCGSECVLLHVTTVSSDVMVYWSTSLHHCSKVKPPEGNKDKTLNSKKTLFLCKNNLRPQQEFQLVSINTSVHNKTPEQIILLLLGMCWRTDKQVSHNKTSEEETLY